MIFVEIILFPEVFLHSSDLTPHIGLLLFPSTAFSLQLYHHVSKLILHCPVKRSNALFLLDELIPDQSIHGVIFSLILHFFTHLLLCHNSFSEIQILLDLLLRPESLLMFLHQSIDSFLHPIFKFALKISLHIPE